MRSRRLDFIFFPTIFIFSLILGLLHLESLEAAESCEWSKIKGTEGQSLSAERAADQRGQVYLRNPAGGDFKGTFTLLHFWATWCPPCLAELPQIDALVNRFKGKNLSVVAVSVDDEWTAVKGFLGRWPEAPRFLNLLDVSRCWASFLGTKQFPESYLFDPAGKLLHRWIGAQQWSDSKTMEQIEGFMELSRARAASKN